MTILYRLMRALTALELGFAIYRRDRINAEIMQGHDWDYLMKRRAEIEREIQVLSADHNDYSGQLDRLAIQGGAR